MLRGYASDKAMRSNDDQLCLLEAIGIIFVYTCDSLYFRDTSDLTDSVQWQFVVRLGLEGLMAS